MTARAAALLFSLVVAAPADTLLLRDGVKITGRWWSADAAQIHFLVDNQLRHYERSSVSSVAFGDAALPDPPAAPPSASAPTPAPASTLPEPEQTGAVYFQTSSGDLLSLERVLATERRRYSAPYWEMPAAHSRVRVKRAAALVFVVKLANGADPATISLYPLEPVKATRLTQAGPGGKGGPLTVSFQVAKVGESTYSLTVRDLPAGEYAFSPSGSNDAYCFAVDTPVPGR